MDTATSHTTEEVKQGFSNLKTNVKFIEGGMTPLSSIHGHSHVNKLFKDGMKILPNGLTRAKFSIQNPVKEKEHPYKQYQITLSSRDLQSGKEILIIFIPG